MHSDSPRSLFPQPFASAENPKSLVNALSPTQTHTNTHMDIHIYIFKYIYIYTHTLEKNPLSTDV